MRRVLNIEVNVVHHNEVEISITIEIQESTASTPAIARLEQSSLPGLVTKGAIAHIAIQNVLPPLRNKQIRVTMVIDISDANALTPAGTRYTGLGCYILKLEPSKIVVKIMARLFCILFEAAGVYKEKVWQAVSVIVENRNPIPRGLNNVALCGL